MKQKYQNTIGFIALVIVLTLLPLLLLAQDYSDVTVAKKIERAVLIEIHQANADLYPTSNHSNNTFTKRWRNHLLSNEDVCSLKEVVCNDQGLITALDLSFLNLEKLPSSIQSLEYLKRLYLHENNLKELPYTIGNLKNLEELSLFENDLSDLDSRLRALCGIKVEKGLSGNPIQQFLTWEEFCRGI